MRFQNYEVTRFNSTAEFEVGLVLSGQDVVGCSSIEYTYAYTFLNCTFYERAYTHTVRNRITNLSMTIYYVHSVHIVCGIIYVLAIFIDLLICF
jgi:hypothetical protein